MAASSTSNVVNIFTSPREAFAALKDRPTFLLPLLLLVAANVAVILWYYSMVDLIWLVETSLEQSNPDMPADAREQVVERMSNTSPIVAGAFAAVASCLFVVVLLLVAGGYLSLVSMMTNDGIGFRHWFSLVSWSSLPVVLAYVATMVNMAINDVEHLPAEALNPLTLANLLALDVRGGGAGARLLQSLDLTSLWSIGLLTLGYATWTRKPLATSFLIVAGPLLVILIVVGALSL